MSIWLGLDQNFDSLTLNNTNWDEIYFPMDATFRWRVGITPLSNWQIIPLTWAAYFATIVALKVFMSNRGPFGMKYISAIHNLILCVGSAVMFLGVMYEVFLLLEKGGLKALYCDNKTPPNGRVYYWMYIYFLSKFMELFDTVVIILKKVYHHAIVILMVWLWLTHSLVYSSLGMAFNTFVHIFMYYYYAVSILGFRVWWKKYITTIQIIQFVFSFLLSIPYVYYTVSFDLEGNFQPLCSGWPAFVFSFFTNLSFLVLFINFWRHTYTSPSQRTKED